MLEWLGLDLDRLLTYGVTSLESKPWIWSQQFWHVQRPCNWRLCRQTLISWPTIYSGWTYKISCLTKGQKRLWILDEIQPSLKSQTRPEQSSCCDQRSEAEDRSLQSFPNQQCSGTYPDGQCTCDEQVILLVCISRQTLILPQGWDHWSPGWPLE